VEDCSPETDRGRKMNGWEMRVNITEPGQTSIPSNAEPEAKPVVIVVSRGGESRKQKGCWEDERLVEVYCESVRKMRMKKRC
jgi:hypothetical protein